MHQLYPIFWFFFAVVLLTQVFPFCVLLFRLLRFEFGEVSFERLDAATPLTPLQQAAIAEVTALGFEKVALYKVVDANEGCTAVLLRHPALPAFANIYLRPGSFLAYPVWFWSFKADGKILMTGNRQPVSISMPNVESEDAFSPSLAGHWQAHQKRMASAPLQSATPEDAYQRITGATRDYPAYNLAQSTFTGKDGKYFLSFKAALRLTMNYMRSRRKLRAPYQTVAMRDAFRSEFFAETYKVFDNANKRLRARRGVSLGLLVITGAVSAGLFTWWLGWKAAAALILVLLVHEFGHAFAMILFGYRDMNMFFIPFLGAVVMGKAKDVPVWKQSIMLLAGPVPGFLAGLWVVLHLHIHTADSFIGLIGIYAVVVNMFNLLPLAFLDGGKLVEITLLSRWPYALVAFDVLSVVILASMMVWMKSYNMLVLVFFMAMTIAPLWRIARMRRAMKKDHVTELPALFALAEKTIGKKSFTRQYYLIRSLYEKATILPARKREIAFALALYFAVWGAAGYAWVDWQHTRTLEARFDNEVKKYYATAKNPDDSGIIAAAKALPAENPRQIDALAIPSLRLEGQALDTALENIISMHRDGHRYTRGALVSIYLGSAGWDGHKKTVPERITALEKALARMDSLAPDVDAQTVDARLRLAEQRDLNGEPEKAKADLDHLLVTTATAANCHCAQKDVVAAEAWYDIDKKQPDKAIKLLESAPYADMTKKEGAVGIAYAWALFETGKSDAGLAQMKIAAPFYEDDDPYEAENLDLIYAYWRAGQTEKAASLIPPKFRNYYCDEKELDLYDGLWHGRAVTGTKEALKAVCAASKPASP